MIIKKILYLLLGVSLLTSAVAVSAAPAPVVDELYDYTGTYTMTEGFDLAKTPLQEGTGEEAYYSALVKTKLFECNNDQINNIKTADGNLVVDHQSGVMGVTFTNAVPGPAEYVINTEDRKASYVFEADFTHANRQNTSAAVYIGVRTENDFNEIKGVSKADLSGNGIWLGVGNQRTGVGSPMFTSSKAFSWIMADGFNDITKFRVYDNVKDNVISYYSVSSEGAESLIATVTVGEYDEENDITPLTYAVVGQADEATVNVSGRVSQGGMYYPQLYLCGIKTNVDYMSVTAAKAAEYGLTSLKVNGEEHDLSVLDVSMPEAVDGKLSLEAVAPYGTNYEILVADAEAEGGFKKVTAKNGVNEINVSGVRLVKLVVTNGTDVIEYLFNYEPAPSFNKDELPTEFRVIYGTDLAIDLDDYFYDEAGELEFYIDDEWIPGRMIVVPTTEPGTYEYAVEARNETTGKSTIGTFTAEVYSTVPVFDEENETEITAILGRDKTVNLAPMFSDETEGELEFVIVTSAGEIEIPDGVWEIDTSEEYYQEYTIKVTNSYSGYYTTQVFTVAVEEEKMFTFTETFDTDKNNFVLTTEQNYSQFVKTKVFGAGNVSNIFVGNGAFRGEKASGSIGNYSIGTRFAVDGTSPYTVDVKFSTNNSYASAGLYFCMRANGFKQFTTAVPDNGTALPSSGIWLAVANSKTLSIGFPARQNAIFWTNSNNFAEMTRLRIFDDTENNVIYFRVVDDATGEETLIAKIEVSYTNNDKTKLKYTVYNGATSVTDEFTVNAVLPQTGNFYPQIWAHDAKVVVESFGVTQKANAAAEMGAVTFDGLTLDNDFSNDTLNYRGEFETEDKIIALSIGAVRGVAYRVYTDKKEFHMIEGANSIDLSDANFLYIEANNGETVKTHTITLENTPYFKSDAEETLYFRVNSTDSTDLTDYFADNCAGTLAFSSDDDRLVFDGNYVSVSDSSAETTFDTTITVTNTTTGENIEKALKVIVYIPATTPNARNIKVYADGADVTPEFDLAGGTADIILENTVQKFKFDVELDYFGSYEATLSSGRSAEEGSDYELGSTRSLTIAVEHDSFHGQTVTYTFNFKLKPFINFENLEEFLTTHTDASGKKGLLAKKDYSLNLNTVFADFDGFEMSGFAVTDERGNAVGTVSEGVWNVNYSAFEQIKLTFSGTGANGVTVSVTKDVEFFRETVPPVFTSERLTVSDIGNTSANVSWSEASDESGIAEYRLFYSKSGNTNKTKVVLENDVTSYEITGLSKGKEYFVYVEAVDTYGNINVNRLSATFKTTGGDGGSGGGGGGGNGLGGGNFFVSGENVTVDVPVVQNKKNFSDLNAHKWAEEAIYLLAEKGVVNGVTETTFEPGRNVTRAEFVAMLVRALNLSGEAAEGFADVNSSEWYYKSIMAAKACGIIKGDGNDFRPSEEISREDMMVITCRALDSLGLVDMSKKNNTFGDIAQVSEYATDAVSVLVAGGIITGDQNGNVNPKASATRAETAVIIDRIIN